MHDDGMCIPHLHTNFPGSHAGDALNDLKCTSVYSMKTEEQSACSASAMYDGTSKTSARKAAAI